MNPFAAIMNAARRLDVLFPGYFPEAKHNHYADFGYPATLTFEQHYQMWLRNGLARAGVEKTVLKTWQDSPEIWETEDPEETRLEADIRKWAADLRLWQRLAMADRASLVGGYSGVILRLADGQRFRETVKSVRGGLKGLVEIIPAWAGQLTVAEWDSDETSPTYGQPKMFQFNEAALPGQNAQGKNRQAEIHPDRVLIWSQDATVHARSLLEPGHNDLLTLEKVSGAGGEGFWKNAKSAPVLQIDKEARLADMAAAMGVQPEGVADAMNEQVEDWQKGFDKLLMLQGMEAKTLGVTLPSPEHFFNIALQSFAASICCPLKILVGTQTGERASTEDARDWAQTCMSRRNDTVRPAVMALISRLTRFGVLPARDWHLHWTDLTESTMGEKLDRAAKMAEINAKSNLELVFLPEEIRAAVDLEPLSEADLSDGDTMPDGEDTPPDPTEEDGDAK